MGFRYESIYFDEPIVPGRVLDIFRPARATRSTALFFVHGGGWRAGSRLDTHILMQAFCAEGYVCGSTDYRLAGVDILGQLSDVRQGYHLFRTRLTETGGPERSAVHGSSAGAHLAALLAMADPGECGEGTAFLADPAALPWQPPVGATLQATPLRFEPWDEMFPHIWTSMQGIVGVPYATAPERYRRVSPVSYIDANVCPIFLLEAENEHMFPLEHSREFAARMRAAGARAQVKVYPGVEHGFFYDLTRRQQREAFRDVVEFVETL